MTKAKDKIKIQEKSYFKLVLNGTNAKILKNLIDTLSKYKVVSIFNIYPENIEFEVNDQGSIYCFSNIQKSFFSEYELYLDDEVENIFSINFENLSKYLAVESSETLITLTWENPDNFITIFVKNPESSDLFRTKLHVIDDEDRKKLSDIMKSIPLTTTLEFTPGLLFNKLEHFAKFLDKNTQNGLISYNTETNIFKIESAEAPENDAVETTIKFNSIISEDKDKIISNYDFEYIRKLNKLDCLQKTVLEYSTNKPVRIILSDDNITIIYVQAPRGAEDEDDNDDLDEDESDTSETDSSESSETEIIA